jgi:lipopolysaccharide export system permease protein
MSMVQAWIAQGRIGVVTGLLGVHVLMLILLAALFYRRVVVFSLFRWVR